MSNTNTVSSNYSLVDSHGTRRWWKNSILHRDDGPAIEYADGTQVWVRQGIIHRDDGPARISPASGLIWAFNGEDLSFNEWCSVTEQTPENCLMLKLKYAVK